MPDTQSPFVPGLELSRLLYEEHVGPILERHHPGLPNAAALLGRGSEVLGYDDEVSTDHDWRPRVLLFLQESDRAEVGEAVDATLHRELPPTFRGHPVGHELHSVRGFFLEQLAVDVDGPIEARDWLTFPEHGLGSLNSGAIFHDEVGLRAARERLGYYPRDVWLYLLIAGWWRLHPESNLAGRAGSVGDELGSTLIGTRLVGDLMRLCFLMEREYAPYSKWFGTAFSRLRCGPDLAPTLRSVVRAETWPERERTLLVAYKKVTALHNDLGLTEPVTAELVRMWDRPFAVAWAGIPDLLHEQLRDPAVLAIAERWPVGPVDQLRDLLWPAGHRHRLLRVFED